MKRFYFGTLLALLILGVVRADSIITVKGSQSGSLKSWPKQGDELEIVDKEGKILKTIKKEEFVSWNSRRLSQHNKGQVLLRLTSGVIIQAPIEEWTEEGVKLVHDFFGEGKDKVRFFSYEDILVLMFVERVQGSQREVLWQKIRSVEIEDEDVLFLKNDYLSGLLAKIGDSVVQFDHDDETKNFKTADVHAVALANEADEITSELILTTTDGFELPIDKFSQDKNHLIFKSALGDHRLRRSRVASLRYVPSNRLFLGNLKPSKVVEGLPGEKMEHYPFGYKINRSVATEQGLATKDRKWQQGIGVHSDSRLTWNLPKGSKSLTGAVGIDVQAWGLGSVHFRIYTDGAKVFDSGLLTGKDEAKYFAVDLKGKKTITLEVVTDPEKEEKDITRDRANWCDLILTLDK